MRLTKVAKTYAKSLLDLAVEKGVLEEVEKDMALILSVCEDSNELQSVLGSPIVPSNKKSAVLKAVFSNSIGATSLSFVELMAQNGRESKLTDVAFAFAHLYLEQKNILRAVVKSVDGVGETLKAKVAELVKSAYNKEVIIEEEKDASLIGGFVITVGDQQVDASVSKQLANMRKALS